MPANNTPRMKLAACKEYTAAEHNGNYVHYISSDSESAAGSADESEPECMDEDADDAEDEDVMQVEPSWRPELWMVKIPKHLMERWAEVDEEGIQLATIRRYPPAPGSGSSAPRWVLSVPPLDPWDGLGPDEYEIDVREPDSAAQPFNECVLEPAYEPPARARPAFAPAWGVSTRKTAPAKKHTHKHKGPRKSIASAVTHHCSLRAVYSARLRERVRARTVAAAIPQRQIKIYEPKPGEVRPECMPRVRPRDAKAPRKRTANRRVRADKAELLDMLFQLFVDRPQWSFKDLQEKTRQPEAYLKKVLPEIAFLHRGGLHYNYWELSANYGDKQDTSSANTSKVASPEVARSDDEAEDEDDDGDLEEVY
ncbi:hypothetical protein VTO73DRAFT_8168 [Trametes versicolor]